MSTSRDSKKLPRHVLIGLRLIVVLLLTTTLHAQSQTRIPSEVKVEEILREGQDLESKKRWSDALTYYENAVRSNPEQPDLKQRLTLAQIHCDLARRYADLSFQRQLRTLSQQQAMAVYADVLLKIETHYVHPPNWRDMLWRGTASIDVAVTKREFTDFHLPRAESSQIQEFRRLLRSTVNAQAVSSRDDARNVVALCGQTALQQVGLDPVAVYLEYTCSAISALDPYSGYLTGSQLDDVYNQIEGNFVGLGIELKADEGSLLIVKTIAGGPAATAGIVAGDRIVEVEGQATRDFTTEEAADMLRGERGSVVNLTVMGADNVRRLTQVIRDEVEVPSVEDIRLLDVQHGIGYFRLSNFQKTTNRDIDAALWRLQRQGMKSLIIDLRGNPGGLLTAAVEAADRFLTHGIIVSTRGRSNREDFDYRAHRSGTWRVPLVVLIDSETASASEIFAAAIRDHHRGQIVGQNSYGKGSVQGIFPLRIGNAGVRLTTAKFYSPSGHAISHRGVQPDLAVTERAKPIIDRGSIELTANDSALVAARRAALSQIVSHR